MRQIPTSELIINDDGSIFHLHLRPEHIADTIILVGDPGRVEQVASKFDSREAKISNREFCTVTGLYRGKRMSVISTGIGTDNIDIVVTELDALVNIDLETRTEREEKRQLTLLRLGTSGALHPSLRIGDMVFARTSIGFDGLLNFYKGRNDVCDIAMEQAFIQHTSWNYLLPKPYFIDADRQLLAHFQRHVIEGITISAPGFYAPQGRWVRIRPAFTKMNELIESFVYRGRHITNYEMESSALAGLSRLMGHRAATICTIIAQRVALDVKTDYSPFVDNMIIMSLDRLAELP
ncbi:MAG: nucleoside phosphorylase [Rikenellaceae bacterium]|jgi:uridine phosphorylase|nr:nucleoside phosphorylase [Rikenellaceae bacterium]